MRDFLRTRRVSEDAVVEPVAGGEINDSYRVSDTDAAYLLRQYSSRSSAAVTRELAFVTEVAAADFPTPAPIADDEGNLWAVVDGRPAALFPWVEGRHPDRSLAFASHETRWGPVLARLIARLHRIPTRTRLTTDDAPPDRVAHYVTRVEAAPSLAALPGMSEMTAAMRISLERYGPFGGRLPIGTIHYDVHPGNVLIAADGAVTVLDFDDAHEAPLVFDVVSLSFAWCRGPDHVLDDNLVSAVVDAYDQKRPLDDVERLALSAALLVDRAAQATGYLLGSEAAMLRGDASVADCGSGRELLALLDA